MEKINQMRITKNQLRQIIKEELTAVLNESPRPPLFSQPSALDLVPLRTPTASQGMPDFDPVERLRSLNAPEQGPKPINIQRVFNAQGDVLDQEAAGADITAQTVRLLAATQAGLPPEGTHIDVTVDMDGKVIGAQVAKQMGEPRA